MSPLTDPGTGGRDVRHIQPASNHRAIFLHPLPTRDSRFEASAGNAPAPADAAASAALGWQFCGRRSPSPKPLAHDPLRRRSRWRLALRRATLRRWSSLTSTETGRPGSSPEGVRARRGSFSFLMPGPGNRGTAMRSLPGNAPERALLPAACRRVESTGDAKRARERRRILMTIPISWLYERGEYQLRLTACPIVGMRPRS
jgi:hypothetical protein